jgi:hypothetical protein
MRGALTVPLPFLRGKLTGSHNFLDFHSIHSTFFFPSHYCIFRGNHSSDADPGPLVIFALAFRTDWGRRRRTMITKGPLT